jgi:hypothetical protein
MAKLPPGVRLQPGLQALAGGACGVERACLAQTAAFFRTDESAMDFSESAMRFPFSNLTKTVSACRHLILRLLV